MYTIIEDCSPYFMRLTHPGIEQVISKCLTHLGDKQFTNGFTHYRYPLDQSLDILDSVPANNVLDLNKERVALFVTQPGYYYRAHKDGLANRYSLNYVVQALDSECATSWYNEEELQQYLVVDHGMNGDIGKRSFSRECFDFDKSKHTPIKSMVARQGECVLVNTEIFHDFDNSTSSNTRMVLTLRDRIPGDIYFEDIKKLIT
jgi:hypothetical protein